jgi:hypothetical protein
LEVGGWLDVGGWRLDVTDWHVKISTSLTRMQVPA